MSTEITSLDTTNATVAAFTQADPAATTTTATKIQESASQRPYREAGDFKVKHSQRQQVWYGKLNEDMKQKRLEQMREYKRKKQEAKRKLRLEADRELNLKLD